MKFALDSTVENWVENLEKVHAVLTDYEIAAAAHPKDGEDWDHSEWKRVWQVKSQVGRIIGDMKAMTTDEAYAEAAKEMVDDAMRHQAQVTRRETFAYAAKIFSEGFHKCGMFRAADWLDRIDTNRMMDRVEAAEDGRQFP